MRQVEERGLPDEVANVLDCDIIVSKFELQSHNYVHFLTNTLGKGTTFPTHHRHCYGSLLFFYKNGFNIF